MKILIAVLLLFPAIVQGQVEMESKFFDYNWKESTEFSAFYIKSTTYEDSTNIGGILSLSTRDGKPIVSYSFSNLEEKIFEGASIEYYENGQLKSSIQYSENRIDNKLVKYFENGQLNRVDFYNKGELISGKCYSQYGGEMEWYPYDAMPEYLGGENALMGYLGEHTVYPEEAKELGVKGQVIVGFTLNVKGEVIDVYIVKSVHASVDKAALDVIKAMDDWRAGIQHGSFVSVQYQLPINFN